LKQPFSGGHSSPFQLSTYAVAIGIGLWSLWYGIGIGEDLIETVIECLDVVAY